MPPAGNCGSHGSCPRNGKALDKRKPLTCSIALFRSRRKTPHANGKRNAFFLLLGIIAPVLVAEKNPKRPRQLNG